MAAGQQRSPLACLIFISFAAVYFITAAVQLAVRLNYLNSTANESALINGNLASLVLIECC